MLASWRKYLLINTGKWARKTKVSKQLELRDP